MQFRLDTSHLRGDSTRVITVTSNDPVRPQLLLTIRAMVIAPVLVLPDGPIKLVNTPAGRRVQRLLRQEANEPGRLNIGGLRASADWIVTKVEKLSVARPAAGEVPDAVPGDWLLEVSLGELPPSGSAGNVQFTTGLERQPTVTVPVYVFVVPPVTLSAQDLILPRSAPQVVDRTVIVNVREGLDPGGLHVDAKPAGLKVDLKPVGPRQFRVEIHWQGEAEGDGAIDFEIGGEHIALPVHWSPVG